MAKPKRQSTGKDHRSEQLNEQSLSSLTAKIEKTLGKPIKGEDSKKNKKRKHSSDEPSASPHQRKKQAQARQKSTNDGQEAPIKPRGKKGGPLSRDDLLEEIRALGGDEEDLKLIGDIDSDQEDNAGDASSRSTAAVDGKLQNELVAFAAQLGLQQYHEEAAANDAGGDDDGGDDDIDQDEDLLDGDEGLSGVDDANDLTPPSPQEPVHKEAKNASKKQFKFEPRADWHSAELSQLPEPTSAEVDGYLGAINALKTHALTLLEADASAYNKSVLASSSRKFLSTIMSSGTLSDKVSALTLAIQESPLHNVKAFESLLGLAAKRSRAQAIGALGALVDLLGPGLVLPPNRRLRTFQTQPGLIGVLQRFSVKSWNPNQSLPGHLTEAHLIQWAYEDWLKTSYFRVIQLLEVWCNDEIEYSRTRSLDFVYGLLKDKPEQETNLLRLLVNKLGDKDRKIASRVSYLLLQLQNTHPGMKQVVIKGIEQEVLLRPGQNFRAKYHATNTLNQTILSNREVGTAEALLRIYFDIFVTLLNSSALGKSPAEGQPEQSTTGKDSSVTTETADKLVTAVLTGINRAVPFVAAQDPILETQMDTLFRIAHSTNFNTSIQALILIQQISVSRQLASDRFYRTLYESLLDPRLANSSKQALYLNLLLRSLKADVDTRRIKAFAKRMLQILNMHQPAFACGLLYVVFQLRVQFPDLRALLEEPEENDVEETAGQLLDQEQNRSISRGTAYDGRKRNPEHSNAQNSCLWEMIPPLTHFHPSVSLLAASLFSDEKQMAKPDLESHSLIRFLDKFVYRSPKVAETVRGASIMQPVRNPDSGSIWLAKRTGSAAAAPINTPSFWNKKVEQVAAEDIFFHEYFKQAGKKNETGKKEATSSAPMADKPEDDAEQEDEIWKALTASHPDGPIDSDESDLDMDGFDDSDADSDGGVIFSDGSDAELSDGAEVNEDAEELEDKEDGDDDEMDERDEASELTALPEEAEEASEKSKRAGRSSKRKLKDLPMFASADDYAELLAQEEDV
ncbi:ribosome biogenesis protein NOP53 [Colletotrichum spaethianum]|uniref:Ribosome biogenesis protein NOP53 n=1 Tax=Colletotrichum spaethianum TaxID=700344 RepID=A0AA37PA31_9PEZI|nr:ribosome biogenesis protein NOP53 [Colletotrichum spaethianum]GKT48401.1 ribosome biogenesis protein NOP53 [Colletotrichum spaethianum]